MCYYISQGHGARAYTDIYFKGTQFFFWGGGGVQNLANLANLIQLAPKIDAHGILGVFG